MHVFRGACRVGTYVGSQLVNSLEDLPSFAGL